MKKIILSICALFLCFTTSVSAAGSIMVNGSVYGYVMQYGKVVDGSYAVFESMDEAQAIQNVPQNVQEQITKLNTGTSILDVIDKKKIKTDLDLSNYVLLTQVQDLKAYDQNGNRIENDATITWEVPNLTKSNFCALCILHYSTKKNTWETIKPDKVDLENNRITVTFKDLSPVAVMYDSSSACSAESKTKESTNTGVKSNENGYLYAAFAALILGFILVFVSFKKKN